MSDNKGYKIHSVKYNFIMSATLRMSSFIFPFITFPYISRILGPDGNGKISFATSVIYYFTTFAALGIPTYGIRICAQCRDDKKKLTKIVHELLILGTILTLIAYAVLIAMVYFVPKLRASSTIILVTSASLLLSNFGVEWFYQAIEQYDYITFRNIFFKVISIILMFIFVKNQEDYVLYAGIQVLGTVGSNILNLIRLRKYISLHPVKNYDIMQHIRPSAVFLMMTIATTVYTNLDMVMLGFMVDDTQVGYYNAAVKMKNILVGLVAALGTVLLPRVSYYVKNKMMTEYKRTINNSFKVVILIALPLTIYCIVESGNILLFLAGDKYLPAISAMVVIMPTILLIGLSNITGIQILVPQSLEKLTIKSTVVGAVVNLLLNTVLIPRFGALGASIGTLVAEASVLAVQFYFLRHSPYIRVFSKDFIKIFASVIVATIALLWLTRKFTLNNSFIDLVWSSVIFFGIYGICLLVTKEEMVQEHGVAILKNWLGRYRPER